MSNLRRLIREIHGRSLWQVLGIYLVSAWFGYEIIDTITDRLALPAWLPVIAIILFIIGLPIVLATAFVQEGVRPLAEQDPTLLPGSGLTAAGESQDGPPGAGQELKRYLTWRNAIMGGVFAFALWGVAAAGWLVLRGAGDGEAPAPSTPAGVTRVVILPFSVHGSDEFDYLGEGMVDLLSTKLDISGGLRSADPRAVLGLLARAGGAAPDPESGRDIARRLGASFYVLGNVVEVGGQLRLDASLYDLDGGLEARAEGSAEGPAANVFDLVDRVAAHNGLHEHLLTYLLGLLSARLGDLVEAERLAAELEKLTNPRAVESLSGDLALGLWAQVALRRGQPEVALGLLERARMQRLYQLTVGSPFISQSHERFLRAALLEEVGRLDEALRWYSSFSDISVYDLVFLAPSHLRRAEIYERRGQYEDAARHYSRFIELWADADPELQPQVQRARDRLAALSAEANR